MALLEIECGQLTMLFKHKSRQPAVDAVRTVIETQFISMVLSSTKSSSTVVWKRNKAFVEFSCSPIQLTKAVDTANKKWADRIPFTVFAHLKTKISDQKIFN